MNPNSIKDKKAIAATKDIHSEAVRRYNDIWSREQDSRELGVEDTRFAQVQGGMYDNGTDDENKPDIPEYEFNLVASAIDTIIGDQRQNETAIRVRPAGSGADKDTAKLFNGIIRNILHRSKFQATHENAFDETLNSGYGGYRVITQFTNDDVSNSSFDQEILIEPINSAVTSLFFGPSKKYDKSDALYAFLVWDEDLDSFKSMYPDATVTDFQQPEYANDQYIGWFNTNSIRMAEYWRKVPIKRKIALLDDGRVIDLVDEKNALQQLEEAGISIVREREIDDWQIERYVMNGAEILKPVEKWAGKFIPLIPQYGKITHLENETYVRGLVRFSKDAMRLYNFLRSTIASVIAKAPKDPYWSTVKKAMGNKKQWENMNTTDDPVLFYAHDPESPGPPVRSGAPQVQQALIEAAANARQDVIASMGVSAGTAQPMAGTDLDMRSGKAIEAQARRGDSGAYVFMSNDGLTQEYLGTVLVDLIPRIIDSTREVETMAEDGETTAVMVNEVVKNPEDQAKNTIVNDLSIGRYSVVVDVGPAFATQRVEAAERLIALSADPASPFNKLAPDLIAKNLDLPGNASEELHDRVRSQMVREGIIEPTEEEAEKLQPTEQQQIAQQQEQEREASETRLLNAQGSELLASAEETIANTVNKDYDSNKKAVESLDSLIDSMKTKVEAGIDLTQTDLLLLQSQQQVVESSIRTIQGG